MVLLFVFMRAYLSHSMLKDQKGGVNEEEIMHQIISYFHFYE
jgi:hypothetical protein